MNYSRVVLGGSMLGSSGELRSRLRNGPHGARNGGYRGYDLKTTDHPSRTWGRRDQTRNRAIQGLST